MNYSDYSCLNWKEILSLTDDYYQVNLFLVKNNTLISQNYILSKSLYYYLIRFGIRRNGASGRRGRTATTRHATAATARHKKLAKLINLHASTNHVLHASGTQPCACAVTKQSIYMHSLLMHSRNACKVGYPCDTMCLWTRSTRRRTQGSCTVCCHLLSCMRCSGWWVPAWAYQRPMETWPRCKAGAQK